MGHKNLQKLFNQPMDRRQFLRHVGLVAAGVVGIDKIVSLLLDPESHRRRATRGWGNGRFGV